MTKRATPKKRKRVAARPDSFVASIASSRTPEEREEDLSTTNRANRAPYPVEQFASEGSYDAEYAAHDAQSRMVEHRDPASGARWNAPSFARRRAELRGSGGKAVERIEDARTLIVWLEDGAEIHVELFERVPNMLDIRCNSEGLIVLPATDNKILVGRRDGRLLKL